MSSENLISAHVISSVKNQQMAVVSWPDKGNIHVDHLISDSKAVLTNFIQKRSKMVIKHRVLEMCRHRDSLLTTLKIGRSTAVAEAITEVKRQIEYFSGSTFLSYCKLILRLEPQLKVLIPPIDSKDHMYYQTFINDLIAYCKNQTA